MSCRKIGTAKIDDYVCDQWQMTWTNHARGIKASRSIWIDQASGITIRSRLVEKHQKPPQSSMENYEAVTELKDIRNRPPEATVLELASEYGRVDGSPVGDGPPRLSLQPYTFRAEAKEVLVDITVRDGKGKLVSDLQAKDFRVFEDGTERPVSGFWYDEHPMAVALVVDSSLSMLEHIHDMQKTAVQVLSQLKSTDTVALVVFDHTVEKIVELTRDRQQISDALGEVMSGGGTDIVNALFVATIYLQQQAPERRRVIILVSDNLAPPYTTTPKGVHRTDSELIDTAQQNETVIYSLRFPGKDPFWATNDGGSRRDSSEWGQIVRQLEKQSISMEKVARETGGEMMEASANSLATAIDILRNRYVTSFVPAPSRSGRPHTITVKLSDVSRKGKDYTLRHRSGYRTPQR